MKINLMLVAVSAVVFAVAVAPAHAAGKNKGTKKNKGSNAVIGYAIDDNCGVTVTSTKDISNIVIQDADGNTLKKWDNLSGKSFSDFGLFLANLPEGTLHVKSGNNGNRGLGPDIGDTFRENLLSCFNTAPVAKDITITATVGEPTTIDVISLGMVSDADGDPINLLIPQNPVAGTNYATSGSISYTPPAGTYGTTVEIEYTVDDGNANNNQTTRTITIHVNPKIYAIGDIGPGGGIVISVNAEGTSGLEAAPEDVVINGVSTFEWGCFGTNLANIEDLGGVPNVPFDYTLVETNDTAGESNTKEIIGEGQNEDACVTKNGGATTAASVASMYEWPEGQTDGFLPNRAILNILFTQRSTIGGFGSGVYLSSSEWDDKAVWLQLFSSSFRTIGFKSFAFRVRAVREFVCIDICDKIAL